MQGDDFPAAEQRPIGAAVALIEQLAHQPVGLLTVGDLLAVVVMAVGDRRGIVMADPTTQHVVGNTCLAPVVTTNGRRLLAVASMSSAAKNLLTTVLIPVGELGLSGEITR
jgi:hypothetical protein